MSVALYADVHVPFAITAELGMRGVDIVTAQDDHSTQLGDPALLARATALGRVLFSQDDDLLRVAREWQQNGTPFAGLIYGHQLRLSIGGCVADLELLSKATVLDEWTNRVEFLPL